MAVIRQGVAVIRQGQSTGQRMWNPFVDRHTEQPWGKALKPVQGELARSGASLKCLYTHACCTGNKEQRSVCYCRATASSDSWRCGGITDMTGWLWLESKDLVGNTGWESEENSCNAWSCASMGSGQSRAYGWRSAGDQHGCCCSVYLLEASLSRKKK